MGLPCLSCRKEVPPDEVRAFAEVFLCQDCHRVATRLYQRGESELKMMLLVLKESIRLAALKGELSFSLQNLDDMKKEDLLSHLSRLADETKRHAVPVEKKDTWTTTRAQIPSPVSSEPRALTANAKRPSD